MTCKDCIHYEVCKHHAKVFEEDGYEIEFDDTLEVEKRCAAFKPTADVVPKSEVEELKHIYKRYNKAIKHERAEVAREIFEEIDLILFDYTIILDGEIGFLSRFTELKKKYQEGD